MPVVPRDISKTAIRTLFDLFEFLRMPFQLQNAAQTFQRSIHNVCHGLLFVLLYVDDILVVSSSPQEHHHYLRMIFSRLNSFELITNATKCMFGVPTLEFFGHAISAEGTRPLKSKVKAIVDLPQPTSL